MALSAADVQSLTRNECQTASKNTKDACVRRARSTTLLHELAHLSIPGVDVDREYFLGSRMYPTIDSYNNFIRKVKRDLGTGGEFETQASGDPFLTRCNNLSPDEEAMNVCLRNQADGYALNANSYCIFAAYKDPQNNIGRGTPVVS